MSLSVSQTQLKGALRELMIQWDLVTAKWDDPMSRAFEADFLAHLEPRVRGTLAAMDHMSDIMARARRDCE